MTLPTLKLIVLNNKTYQKLFGKNLIDQNNGILTLFMGVSEIREHLDKTDITKGMYVRFYHKEFSKDNQTIHPYLRGKELPIIGLYEHGLEKVCYLLGKEM